MAISTYKTYLCVKGTGYTKLVDIKNFPDLGSEPDMIDITTLSDAYRHYLAGIQDTGALNFDFNADATTMSTVQGKCGTEQDWAVCFGDDDPTDTTNCVMKFVFKGVASAFVTGGGVNEAVNGRITIALTSDISTATPS